MADGHSLRRILLVDDEPMVHEMWLPQVECWGYDAIGARDLEEARRALRDCAPDGVILDLKLKEGTRAGFDLLREVRESNAEIAVLVLTAHGGVQDVRDAMQLGADTYCTKGEAPETIQTLLERALLHRSMSAALAQAHSVRAAQLDALSRLSFDLTRPDACRQVLRTFVALAVEHAGCECGVALVADDDRVPVECYLEGLTPKSRHDVFVIARICPTLRGQKAQEYEDIGDEKENNAYHRHFHEKPRGMLILPMVFSKDIRGSLTVCSQEPRRFTPDTRRFIEILARQAAVLIENALAYRRAAALDRLVGEIRQAAHESDLLDRVAHFVRGWFGAEDVLLHLHDRDGVHLPAGSSARAPLQEVAERVMEDEQSWTLSSVPDPAPGRGPADAMTLVAARLESGGEHLGALVLADRAQPEGWERRFTRLDKDLLCEMARRIASAIAKTRLRQTAERRARELDALNRINEQLNRAASKDEVLRTIAFKARELLGARSCSVFERARHDELYHLARKDEFPRGELSRPTFLLRATSEDSLHGFVGRAWYLFGEKFTGRLADARAPIIENDLAAIGEAHPKYGADAPSTHILGTPLLSSSESVAGAIKVLDRLTGDGGLHPEGFTPKQASLLADLARQAALVLERTSMIDSIRRTADLQRTLHHLTDMLQRERAEEEIFYLFLTGLTIGSGLGFNRAILLVPDEREERLVGHMAIGATTESEAERIWKELDERGFGLPDAERRFVESGYDRSSPLHKVTRGIRLDLTSDDAVFPACTFRDATPVRIDQKQKPRPVDEAYLAAVQTEAFALVPLVAGGRVLGIVHVDNRFNSRPISEDEISALEIFAGKAASAVDNARLIEEARLTGYLSAAPTLHRYSGRLAALRHSLSSALDRAADAVPLDPRLIADIRRVDGAVAALCVVSRELVLLSREERPQIESVDLARTLPRWLEKQIPANGSIQLLSADGVSVRADRRRLLDVLRELVSNARRCVDGREIRLGHGPATADDLSRRIAPGRRRGHWVRVFLEDDGPGIHDAMKERIFQPLVSDQSSPGSGMGLAVARKSVEDQGGYLFEDGTYGEGARFVVLLPRA